MRPLPGKPHAFARVPTPLRPRQRACLCPDTLTATDRMTTVSTLQQGTRSPRRPSGEERGHSCPEHTQGLAGTAGASSVWGHAQGRPCQGPSWSVRAGTRQDTARRHPSPHCVCSSIPGTGPPRQVRARRPVRSHEFRPPGMLRGAAAFWGVSEGAHKCESDVNDWNFPQDGALSPRPPALSLLWNHEVLRHKLQKARPYGGLPSSLTSNHNTRLKCRRPEGKKVNY